MEVSGCLDAILGAIAKGDEQRTALVPPAGCNLWAGIRPFPNADGPLVILQDTMRNQAWQLDIPLSRLRLLPILHTVYSSPRQPLSCQCEPSPDGPSQDNLQCKHPYQAPPPQEPLYRANSIEI